MRRIRLNQNWTITGFSLVLIGIFLYLLHALTALPSTEVLPLDLAVLERAKELRTFGLTRYFLEITSFGGVAGLVTLTLVVLALLGCAGRWRNFCQLLVVGLLTPVLSFGLKNLAGRARPAVEVRLDYVSSFTFPSGHALAAASIYLTLAFMCLPLIKSGRRQVAFLICMGLFVFTIGLSRIYLGVHYVTDVAGGFCLGTGFACLANIGFNTFWKSSPALEKLDHVP